MRFIGHKQGRPVVHYGQLPVRVWRGLSAPPGPGVADQAGAGRQSGLRENLAFVDRRATHDQRDDASVRRRIAYVVKAGLQLGAAQVLHVATISSPRSTAKPFRPRDGHRTLRRAWAVNAHVPATVNGERLPPPATPPMEQLQTCDTGHEVELARINEAQGDW